MLELLKNESTVKNTFNGAKTYSTSNSECLDLFFRAGAMRNASSEDIAAAVRRAYAEDPVRTMKIIFFARDIRGGLGERIFLRIWKIRRSLHSSWNTMRAESSGDNKETAFCRL